MLTITSDWTFDHNRERILYKGIIFKYRGYNWFAGVIHCCIANNLPVVPNLMTVVMAYAEQQQAIYSSLATPSSILKKLAEDEPLLCQQYDLVKYLTLL